MTSQPDTSLIERLRTCARQKSEASRMLAEAKSLRQTDHEGPPRADLYSFVTPEQTDEWKAADRIEALSTQCEAMRSALAQWKCDACGGSGEYLNKRYEYPDDMGPASLIEEMVPCKRCDGHGLHPVARTTLHPEWTGQTHEGED